MLDMRVALRVGEDCTRTVGVSHGIAVAPWNVTLVGHVGISLGTERDWGTARVHG